MFEVKLLQVKQTQEIFLTGKELNELGNSLGSNYPTYKLI